MLTVMIFAAKMMHAHMTLIHIVFPAVWEKDGMFRKKT